MAGPDAFRVPRQERGQRRRDAIATTAAELLVESGFAAVTHRAVARRCGVPLGSTTYYFGSRDDLLAAGTQLLVDRWITHAADVADRTRPAERYDPRLAARVLVRALLPATDRDALLAHYEQLVGAVRQPAVADVIRAARPRLLATLGGLIARVRCPDWIGPDHVLAVVDGAVVSALSEGRPDVSAYAEALLADALE